jgi:hypothetical protein
MSGEIVIHRDDIVKQGWLSKESLYLKDWRKRWVVLTKDYICTFKTQGEFRNPTEAVRLRECSTVKSAHDATGKENSFQVYATNRTFSLMADSSVDKEAWIGTIGRQMVRPTMMVEEYDFE